MAQPQSTANWTDYRQFLLARDENGVDVPSWGPAGVLTHEDVATLMGALRNFLISYRPEQIAAINQDERDFYHGDGVYAGRPRAKAIRRTDPGFVYLLRGEGGYYKIGKTADLERRLKDFRNLPWGVYLVASKYVPDMAEVEAAFLKMFRGQQVKGEWFTLDDLAVETVKGAFR